MSGSGGGGGIIIHNASEVRGIGKSDLANLITAATNAGLDATLIQMLQDILDSTPDN